MSSTFSRFILESNDDTVPRSRWTPFIIFAISRRSLTFIPSAPALVTNDNTVSLTFRAISLGAAATVSLLSSVVVAIIWALASSYTRDKIKGESYRTQYAESASEQIQKRCNSSDLATQRNCIEEIITATHENQRDESDLQAQWQMAYWAYAMVIISGFSFIATIAGIYFVRENLLEMEKARGISKEAVDTAREANRNTLEAIKFEKENSHRELRAYIGSTGGGVDFRVNDKTLAALISIKNFGQTPAYDVMTWFEMKVLPTQATAPSLTVPTDTSNRSRAPHNPSQDNSLRFDLDIHPHYVDLIKMGVMAIFVRGIITYRDAFQKPQTTNFSFKMTGPEGLFRWNGEDFEGWPLNPTFNGNEAT